MSRTKYSILFALVLCFILSACDSGPKPVEITELTIYKDEIVGFSIKHPENWVTTRQPGERFVVFSTNETKSRFINYDADGFPGAMIDVYSTRVDTNKTEDDLIVAAKRFSAEIYKESTVTVDGVQGRRFDYTFPLKDGDFNGMIIIASKDEITYTTLKIEAFAGSWKFYEDNFNQIISSLKLAVTPQRRNDTVTVVEDLPFPSENLVQQRGVGFSILIPDNFYLGRTSSANMIASYNYIGDRRGDCNIQIDVLDGAQVSDLNKAATELASRYPGSPSVSRTKIGGTDGYIMNWRPSRDVRGRVYFARQGDRIFRISINWYAPEEAHYLPIFERSVASIKFD